MDSISAFDTLYHSEILKEAGIPTQYCHAITGATHYAISQSLASENLATKEDVEYLKREVYSGLAKVVMILFIIQLTFFFIYLLVHHTS